MEPEGDSEEAARPLGDLPVAETRRPDVFLLYNSKQQGINELVQELRARKLDVWYSRDSLTAGDNWDALETKMLREAGSALIVLGTQGWGSYQQQFAQVALDQQQSVIPVVLESANADTFGVLGGLFHELKRVHLESPTDARGLDEIVTAVRKIVARKSRTTTADADEVVGLPKLDPEPILRKLTSDDEDDRAVMLDELPSIAAEYDCEPLWRAILERPELVGAADEDAAPIRGTLLRALPAIVTDLDSEGSAPESVVSRLLGALQYDSSDAVRWEAMAGLIASRRAFPWLHEVRLQLGHALPQLLEVATAATDAGAVTSLRAALRETGGDRTSYLRALSVVPVPALAEELLSSFFDRPDTLRLLALAHPELGANVSVALKAPPALARFVETACVVVGQAPRGRYLARRVSRLLTHLPGLDVVAPLRALSRGSGDSAAGAIRLLAHLNDPHRVLVAGYHSEGGTPADDLDIKLDVQTLCAVILAQKVEPPLSIGLFGDWGTGKSYFMDAMWERLEAMTREVKRDRLEAEFHTSVAQIRFNAWHYIDANLWASLVSHIIEELTLALTPEKVSPDIARKALVTELETAKQIKKDAEDEQGRAEEARKDAEKALGEAAKARAEKQVKLGELRAGDIWAEIREDPALAEALKSSGNLGLSQAVGSVEELEAAVTEAHTLAGRVRALFVEVPKSTSGWTLALLVIVLLGGAPLAIWGLRKLMPDQPLGIALSAAFAEVTAVAATLTHALRGPLKLANDGLNTLTDAKRRALTLLAAKQKERTGREIALEKEVNELRAKEQNAAQQLSTAQARVQEITNRIRELDDGRSFSKYLLERLQADDYRRHLGIVSTIRKDFSRLEQLLKEAAKNTNTEPIQRIVLYVDDLDRCPAERVLEVLQAVHLLLAFKLFVVVVGVDPRWLMHSLERSYSAFRPSRVRDKAWRTTPQNYLEKIFQIPFCLNPMDKDGFGRLIHTLLPVTEDNTSATATDRPSPNPKPGAASTSSASPAPAPAPTPAEKTAPTPAPRAEERSESAPTPSGHGGASKGASGSSAFSYGALRIRTHERDFAARLHELVPSPRAAKRFTNVYRLLKARLSDEELVLFEGSKERPGTFRAVMLLLVLLAGFPESAPDILRKLGAANRKSATEPFLRAAARSIPDRDRAEYEREVLGLLPALPPTLEPFVEWAPKVARFSFAATKSLS